MSLTDIEETGGGYFAMAACRELLDELPRHVLITYDGESWEIHVQTQSCISESSCQKLAFERVSDSDNGHASVERCAMLHQIAFYVE